MEETTAKSGARRRGLALAAATILAALPAVTAAAAPGAALYAILRVEAPHDLNPNLDFPAHSAVVVIVEDPAEEAAYLNEDACHSETRHPRCQVLGELEPGRGRCLAVMLDTQLGVLRARDYRLGTGADATEARRQAVYRSSIFNALYMGERLTNPFRTITQIHEHILDHDEDWLDRIVAERCRSDTEVKGAAKKGKPAG